MITVSLSAYYSFRSPETVTVRSAIDCIPDIQHYKLHILDTVCQVVDVDVGNMANRFGF